MNRDKLVNLQKQIEEEFKAAKNEFFSGKVSPETE